MAVEAFTCRLMKYFSFWLTFNIYLLLLVQIHIASPNAELVQAALQALGFCVYHSHVVSEIPGTLIYIVHVIFYLLSYLNVIPWWLTMLHLSIFPETFATEILTALCSLVVKSPDKNTCIRALWVISKQSFPSTVVAKKVIISSKCSGSCDVFFPTGGKPNLRCLPLTGLVHTGNTNNCVDQREHPVYSHGAWSLECCHQVKINDLYINWH